MKPIRYILLIAFSVHCAETLFAVSSAFVDRQIAPKYFCFAFVFPVVALLYLFAGRKTEEIMGWLYLTVGLLCAVQASYGLLQYAGVLLRINGFRITGSFDNPAGFAASLCAGFPFLFYFIRKKQVWQRGIAMVAVIIIVIALILSASRAGMISLFATTLFFLSYQVKISTQRKVVLLFITIIMALSGLYFLKKDSADGRLVIWRCSWEMIKDKPVSGHGPGGFKANYMNYQAYYFERHPDSPYIMLTDNVNRPFNEYIGLAVNYGLAGVILLLATGWFIRKPFLRCKNDLHARVAACCLLAIAVSALFSYPLRYPFVWTMMIWSIVVILCRAEYPVRISDIVIRSVLVLTVPAFLLFARTAYRRMTDEMLWCRIANQSLAGKTEQMLPEYRRLYPSLAKNELFLYNYAAELNVVADYDGSLQIARECERLWADYDLQMLLADNYQQLQLCGDAEVHYRNAANMCPVKFLSLYRLAKLYHTIGDSSREEVLAKIILNKKVKIPSSTISAIKQEMQQLIKEKDPVSASESRISIESINKIAPEQSTLSEQQTPKELRPP